MSDFVADYYKKIVSSIGNNHKDNHDHRRFGVEITPSVYNTIKRKTVSVLASLDLFSRRETESSVRIAAELLDGHIEGLKWLYDKLGDDESRQILIEVLAYRALGYRKVKLSTNRSDHWENFRVAESLVTGDEVIDTGFMGFILHQLDLGRVGYPIKMFGNSSGIVASLIEEQYRCLTASGAIECQDGDCVIDAGGCWGDTALYFAQKVGQKGKVISFEFLDENLQIFEKNLDLNSELSKRIQIIRNPVWSSSDEMVCVSANGPATQISNAINQTDNHQTKCRTVAIDDLVINEKIEKIDFIKMDIEGAELNALKGAEKSIRKFKPRMAITVYHSLQDFWEIPMFINSLDLGYEFYLRHYTIHMEETVLYAKPL